MSGSDHNPEAGTSTSLFSYIGTSKGNHHFHTSEDVEHEDWVAFHRKQRSVFQSVDAMKKELRARLTKPEYNVSMYYHDQGIAQKIARHPLFEQITLIVITMNALWITVDADYNPSEVLARAPIGFQLVEQLFCFFFVFEWVIRFAAFKRKRDGLRDAWFVFDTLLTILFVTDTWFMYLYMKFDGGSLGQGLGDASLLRIARLVRFTRMARMAHILNSVPELSILLRGLGAGMRSVAVTLVLLGILLYVFGIGFRLLCSEEVQFCNDFFGSVPESMHTLLIYGTLMDDLKTVVYGIEHYNLALLLLFYIFLVLAAVTMMNMLIGILCDVVNNTATVERETLSINYVKFKLEAIMRRAGRSDVYEGEAKINKEEFLHMIHNPLATALLKEVGVDAVGLVDFADFIFKDDLHELELGEEKLLSFTDFVEVVMQLRGNNTATVRDIVDLRKFVQLRFASLETKLDAIAVRSKGKGRVMTASASASMTSLESRQDKDLRGVNDADLDADRLRRISMGVSAPISPPASISKEEFLDEDMEKLREKSDEFCGMTDCTDDLSPKSIFTPKRTAQPFANREDIARGSDFRNLVHSLVMLHETAVDNMHRHNERLQAQLEAVKSYDNLPPTAVSRAEAELDVLKSSINPVTTTHRKPEAAANDPRVASIARTEGIDINSLEVDSSFSPRASGDESPKVDWASYISALRARADASLPSLAGSLNGFPAYEVRV